MGKASDEERSRVFLLFHAEVGNPVMLDLRKFVALEQTAPQKWTLYAEGGHRWEVNEQTNERIGELLRELPGFALKSVGP